MLLIAPAGAQAAFSEPAPFQDTRPPAAPQPVTSVFAHDTGTAAGVRITRSFTDGRSQIVADVPTDRDVLAVATVHNTARDSLTYWIEVNPAQPGEIFGKTVFWAADAAAPLEPRGFPISSNKGNTVFAMSGALDQGRSATMVFQLSEYAFQAHSSDVTAVTPSSSLLIQSEPPQSGVGVDWTYAPDGRGIYAFKHRFQATGSAPTHFKLLVSTRVPGQPFTQPVSIAGGPNTNRPLTLGAGHVALAPKPGGRAMVTYGTSGPEKTTACPYPDDGARSQVHVALGTIDASGPNFSHTVVSDTTRHAAVVRSPVDERPIVGQDDRFGVHWIETSGYACDPPETRMRRHNFAYTVPGQGMTTTGPPPPGFDDPPPDPPYEGFNQWWFQCDGDLYFKFKPAGTSAFLGTVWDTNGPAMCGGGDPPPGDGDPPPGGGDPPPGGGDPPPGGGTPPPVPPVDVPSLTTAFKASRKGTVRMTLTTVPDGDARIELLAKKSSLRAAAKTTRVGLYRRKTVKGVPTSLTLKLKGKAKRVLRKKGRLKITVRTTFTPAGGGTKLVKSKSVIFKQPKR